MASKVHLDVLGPEPTAPPLRQEAVSQVGGPEGHRGRSHQAQPSSQLGRLQGQSDAYSVISWLRVQPWICIVCIQILAPLIRAV